MKPSSRSLASIAVALALASPAIAAHPGPPRSTNPLVFDFGQSCDVNGVSMTVSNVGSFAFPGSLLTGGFEFPKGSGKTAVFEAGLWLDARVNGQIRMAVAEYSQEYEPGTAGALFDAPQFKVFKLNRRYASDADRDAALIEYKQMAVPYGAPPVSVLPDGSLSIRGDQMLWSVCNDADPGQHIAGPGGTAPLGVEVRQTTYAYNSPGALGQVVLMNFRIDNRSPGPLADMIVGLWADTDLGGARDDLAGCDTGLDLGFDYNATESDTVYGAPPPAVGVALLRGPVTAANDTIGMTAFSVYSNGSDPLSYIVSDNLLHGLNGDGSPVIDPTTGQPTRFMFSGDPVTQTGWLDPTPSDVRLLLGSGPFTLAPGASQDVIAALIVGQGTDRLSSLTALRLGTQLARLLVRGDLPTPTLPALVGADATPGQVSLHWYAAGMAAATATVERNDGGQWSAIAGIAADGLGDLYYVDRAVEAGRRYGYRLAMRGADGAVVRTPEIWVSVPDVAALALDGFKPNPADRVPFVSFTLPDAGPASLEVLDLGGRRVAGREVGSLGPGVHVLALGGSERLAPGVYFIRLIHDRRALVSRGAVVP